MTSGLLSIDEMCIENWQWLYHLFQFFVCVLDDWQLATWPSLMHWNEFHDSIRPLNSSVSQFKRMKDVLNSHFCGEFVCMCVCFSRCLSYHHANCERWPILCQRFVVIFQIFVLIPIERSYCDKSTLSTFFKFKTKHSSYVHLNHSARSILSDEHLILK